MGSEKTVNYRAILERVRTDGGGAREKFGSEARLKKFGFQRFRKKSSAACCFRHLYVRVTKMARTLKVVISGGGGAERGG